MKLIVGLGNPGKQYEKTRHNTGFMVVEQFLKDFESVNKTVWENSSKFKSDMIEFEWQPRHGELEKVILAKPKTYMNNSGMAVSILVKFYHIVSSDVWIVHDDIDLPLGNMKIRCGGAAAGHHGVESVMQSLNTDKFWRFRMGTGSKSSKFKIQNSKLGTERKKYVEDYVLGNFTGQERGRVKDLIKKGSNALQTALEEGLERAMNRYNK